MDGRTFTRAVMALALISLCKGKLHDFGKSSTVDMSLSDIGSLSTYFWDDKENTINVSVAGSKSFGIFNYNLNDNSINLLAYKNDGTSGTNTHVSAGPFYGCFSEDGNQINIYGFNGVEISGPVGGRGFYKPFTWDSNVYAFDENTAIKLKYYNSGEDEAYIKDVEAFTISYNGEDIHFHKIIDDRYFAYFYPSTTINTYEIVDLRKDLILHTISVTTVNCQYTDIGLNDKYIVISTGNIIQLYLRATNKPTDSIVEQEDIIACTFDKNTGLVYYATTSHIVCADPEDFKWSSTTRYDFSAGDDYEANNFVGRRGDFLIHRSGRLLFTYLHRNGNKYEPKLFNIEVDKLDEIPNKNAVDCLDNPIHRVWSLKDAKCKLKMSLDAEKDCREYKCIEGKPADIEEIVPSTGSAEGGTLGSIKLSNVDLSEIPLENITIFLGEANAIPNILKSSDGSTIINFTVPSSNTDGYVNVTVFVNNKTIHNTTGGIHAFKYYRCGDNKDCTTCTAHSTGTKYASECKWCALENICKSKHCGHNATGRELGNCPSFTISTEQFSAPGKETHLRFSMKGERNVSGVEYYCHPSEKGGNGVYDEEVYGNATLVNDILTCMLPAVDDNVSVVVTTSVSGSTRKTFYAESDNELVQAVCESFKDCQECLEYSHCVWHFNETGNDFLCGLRSNSPAYAYDECPAVEAIKPASIEYGIYDGSAIPIEVSMNGEIPPNKTYTCTLHNGVAQATSAGKWVNANTVSCEIPEGFVLGGGRDVDIRLAIGSSESSEHGTFYSLQCNTTTDPSMCVEGEGNKNGLCGWCFSENTCSSKCDAKCWVNSGRPAITSIEPPIFNIHDKTSYTIKGTGFTHPDCGVQLQCVATEVSTGKVKTVDATYVSSTEIHCLFDETGSAGPATTSSDPSAVDDDSDDSHASGSTNNNNNNKNARRDYIASFKVAREPSEQQQPTYTVGVKDAKSNPLYDLTYKNGAAFPGIDCGSRDTCVSCTTFTGNASGLFSEEYCKWDVLRGVCTAGGEFTAGRDTGRACPAITGFMPPEAKAGNEVTIVGEGFVESPKLFVSIADKSSGKEVLRLGSGNYTYHNTTHISFVFPELPAGDYGVTLVSSEEGGSAVVAANAVANLRRPKDGKDNTVTIVVIVVVCVVVIAAIVAGVVAFAVHRKSQGGLSGFDFDIKNEPEYIKYKFAASLTNGPKLDKRLSELIPLLQNPAVACAICDVTQSTEADKVTNSLVYIQASGGCAVPFITTLINEEIPRTPNEKQLFRGDGVISKAFRAYSKIVGLRYLWLTLGRVLNEIDYLARMQDKSAAAARDRKAQQDCELSEGVNGAGAGGASSDISDENAISILDTEVDPSKLSEGANLDAKVHLLYQRCSIVLDPILKSEGNMPPVLREILHTIYQKVGEVFPGSEHIGIAGTFFLRFVCPSITIPQTYGLLKEPPIESLQRQLTLIAKVLQNTANNCNFGKKEPFMVALNGFVGTNCVKVADFMERIASSQGAQEEKQDIPQDVINASVRFMKGHIANVLKKLPAAMEKRGVSQYYQEIADIVSQ